MKTFNLKAIISVIDKVTGPMRGITSALQGPAKAMQGVAQASGNLSRQVAGMAGPMAVIGGAGGLAGLAFSVKPIIETSAQFEKFEAILKTVEGSSAKAKASMDWVSKFAATTPYELAEVTEAFVKLKAYGINPQGGALAAAGNAAAALGKPLEQAVEALADAMTGENERLKEFGIKAKTEGDKIVYNWVENGKTMTAVANKNSQTRIQAVVKGIWNRRYSGAMDNLSQTWEGMWSNLMDTFTRFKKMIGDGGFFDVMKGNLAGLLALFGKWEADGTLKAIAMNISDGLTTAVTGLMSVFKDFDISAAIKDLNRFLFGYTAIGDSLRDKIRMPGVFEQLGNVLRTIGTYIKPITDRFGTLNTAVGGFALVIGGPLIAAMASVIAAMTTLGAVVLANPIFLAVAALAGAAALIYANWDSVGPWFGRLWGNVKQIFGGFGDFVSGVFTGDLGRAWEGIKAVWSGLGAYVATLWDGIKGVFLSFVNWIDGTFGTNIQGTLESVWATVKGTFAPIEQWSADLWKRVEQTFGGFKDFLSGIFTADLNKVVDGIKSVWGGLIGYFRTLWDGIGDMLSEKIRGLTSMLPNFMTEKLGLNVTADASSAGMPRSDKTASVISAVGRPLAEAAAPPLPTAGQPGASGTRPASTLAAASPMLSPVLAASITQTAAPVAPPPEVRGSIDININGAPPGTRVTSRQENGNVGFNVDVGYRSMAMG